MDSLISEGAGEVITKPDTARCGPFLRADDEGGDSDENLNDDRNPPSMGQTVKLSSHRAFVAGDDDDVLATNTEVKPTRSNSVMTQLKGILPEQHDTEEEGAAKGVEGAGAAAASGDKDAAVDDEEERAALVEEERDLEWRLRSKHVFVLNSSGRPIFTRYGDESDFVDLFGIFRVLISMASSSSMTGSDEIDSLRRIVAGPNHTMHFYNPGELIYVMVTRTGESAKACHRQLRLFHNQILSVLPTANAILLKNASYDIRRMFSNADLNVMKSLIKRTSADACYHFRAMQAVGLPPKYRSDVDNILRSSRCSEDHLFSFIFHRQKVVSVVTPVGSPLHPDDALLLLNFAACQAKTQSGVLWAPICLPLFNDSGYLWCYCQNISIACRDYLRSITHGNMFQGGDAEDAQRGHEGLLLVQIAVSQDMFSGLVQSGQMVIERLSENNTYCEIESISEHATCVPVDAPLTADDKVNPPLGLWYTLVSESGQLVSSTQAPLMARSRAAQKQTLRQWIMMKDKLSQVSVAPNPFFLCSTDETSYFVLRQRGIGDVYGAFVSSVAKSDLLSWGVRWAKWVKARESTFTILTACTW